MLNKRADSNSVDDDDSKTPPKPSLLVGGFWMSSWFVTNIGLTLANKAVFQFYDFHYPLTLSWIHLLCTALLSSACLAYQGLDTKPLDWKGYRLLILFSALFCSNIVLGNVGLRHVSVSTVQVIRSIIPGVTVVLSVLLLRKSYPGRLYLALVFLCAGVAMASMGDTDFHFAGVCLMLLVCFLSSLKTVVSNIFLVGDLRLEAMDLLLVTSFFSVFMLLPFVYVWEYDSLRSEVDLFLADTGFLFWLFLNGIAAFLVNITNFMTNKTTSPLAVTVAGNIKHIVTIVLSVIVFRNIITVLNAIGIMVASTGGVAYSYVEFQLKYPKR